MPFCLFDKQKNVLRKQRNWERQLAAKKNKRKEEKQRRKLNREKESGKYQARRSNHQRSFRWETEGESSRHTCLPCVFCPTGATGDAPQLSKRALKAITRERLAEAQSTGLKLCVDLSMTDSMSDKVGDDEQASNQYQYLSNSLFF